MASSELQFSRFRSCSNVHCTSTVFASKLHSLGVTPRSHPKYSMRFASGIAWLRVREVQKQCIVRAVFPEASATFNTPAMDFQGASERGLIKGINRRLTREPELYDDQVHLEKSFQYVVCSTTECEQKISEVVDSEGDEKKRKTHENLNFEEDVEDEEDDFGYDWPPLVCCFGAVRNGFIPITRRADNQLNPDPYSMQKGMQWSVPESVRALGPPSNVAIALVQLGGRAAVMGKVGEDHFGHQMVLTLNLKRVQTRGVRFDPCVSTAVSYMKLTRQDGKLALTCLKPCAEDSLLSSEINVDILKEARMFHFNSTVLLAKSMHSTLLAAVEISKKFGGIIFFDVDLSLPLWMSRNQTRSIIQEAWNRANVIEVTKEELEFLLDNDYFEKNRCDTWSVSEMKIHMENYHYTREEISPLWHDNIKILFVTEGTFQIHYYTPKFDGSVTGIEDVPMIPLACDRSTWGDAVVAGIMSKLTREPELYNDQVNLEKALQYAICSARETVEKKSEMADSGNDEERKKTNENQDKSEEFEEDVEDDEDDFEYDWPPLVCCFGAAQNEFIPNIRLADKQMDPDMYSTWKGLQWSLPELDRVPGPPSNVAISLVRLGGRAAFMGKVGHDPFGHQMVLTLNLNRVQTRGIQFDPCVSTAVSYMKLTRQDGKLTLICLKPCAEDSLLSSEINVDILKEARMFHFNSMVLLAKSMRSTLLAAVEISKKFGGIIFFDVNLPLPLWRSRDETKRIILEAWNGANVIEVTKEELEFLLDENYFEERRNLKSQFCSRSVAEMNKRLHEYHYTREEISPLWHDSLKILFVTEGTRRIHYYTPAFDGSVSGTEDLLMSPFVCDKSASDDAIVAGIIRKLTIEPEIYNDQVHLETALRFAICSGIIAQWRIGGIRGFPTERTSETTKDQVYIPSTLSRRFT